VNFPVGEIQSCNYRDALLQRKIRSSYFVLRS
jgi:hypothetical protein